MKIAPFVGGGGEKAYYTYVFTPHSTICNRIWDETEEKKTQATNNNIGIMAHTHTNTHRRRKKKKEVENRYYSKIGNFNFEFRF